MENGVEIVDGSNLGERKGVEDGIFEVREEPMVLSVSCRSKDSEEDELFEEAVEQLQEQLAKLDAEDLVVNAVLIPEELRESVLADGNSHFKEPEGEVFEEAIEVLDDAGTEEGLGVVAEERVEDLVSKEDVLVSDGIVEEKSINEVADDELNELDNGGDNLKVRNDFGADGEREVSEDGSKVREESSIDVEKSDNGDSSILVSGSGEVHEKSENADVSLAGEDVTESYQEEGTEGDIVLQDGKDDELEDNYVNATRQVDEGEEKCSILNGVANSGTKQKDGESGEPKFTSAYLESQVENGVVVKDNVAVPSIEHQVELNLDDTELNCLDDLGKEQKDTDSKEPKVSSAYFVSKDDNGEVVKDYVAELDLDSEQQDDSEEKNGEADEASAGLDSGVQDDHENDLKSTLNHLDSEQQDESEEGIGDLANVGSEDHSSEAKELKDTAVDAVSELVIDGSEVLKDPAFPIDPMNHENGYKDNGIADKVLGSVEESPSSTLTSEERSMSSLAGGNTDQNERIQDRPSFSEAEEFKGFQPQRPVENGDTVSKNQAESVTVEKKKDNVKEEKRSTQVNGEREIRPASGAASSSGKSENLTSLPARPSGLGRAAPLLEPAPRVVQQSRVNGAVSQGQAQLSEETTNGEAEENDETREKLQMIRVKFLRLAHRLGQTPHNVVVAQVLYRLGLAEQLRGRNGGRVGAFSFDRASAMAEQLEAAGQEPLDFSCTIMVLGKTGVGKSATINSIFDEVKFGTDAFQLGTKKVQDVVGTVQGIKVRVIDTPGLLPSSSDQRQNEKILQSVKRFIKKTPPDIVLYLDRLDMQSRDFGDMPLLRTITEIFGPSIWFNAIVVLTHAASAPPDGPNGTASSYDMFVTQRSHVVQQAIRQAAGDMRLMNPVSLVENHSACRTNRAGQRVLPNGQVWKPHLLLLSFASKILAEANTLLKLQDSPPGKPFASRSRAPPLPYLLSSLLQSRPQLRLPEEQFGDEDTLDDELDESSDSDDESEYDELPPFKRLTKAQLNNLTKTQKKAYFDELEYRENLLVKKQLKEEKRRRKMLKKMAASAKDLPSEYSENVEEESGAAASVPVAMPDLALPASFDSDNPTHRYRYLDSSNQWLVRPVLETHGWDHDVGYEGINVERLFVVKEKVPLSFSGQVTKDKKDANLQMEVASSIKHGEGKATSLGFDMQTVGKDISYTLRSESRFSNYRRNKATAGLSVTLLGDALSAGVKLEDKLIVNKRFRMVMTGGAMASRGDVAYGGSLEATLRDRDYPLGRSLSTLGLSVMDWHGDLATGCNIQSQIPIGRYTNMIARANLNNRGAGQVSLRFNSSEQLQIALIGLIPLFQRLLGYSQQMQFGQ